MKIAGIEARPPASTEKCRALESILPPNLPADYLTFFERCDGVDIWFDNVDWSRDEFDYLHINSVDEMLDSVTRKALDEIFSELFVIGTDGGGRVLAYDRTQPVPWPIVMHPPGYSEPGRALVVALSMTELVQIFVKA